MFRPLALEFLVEHLIPLLQFMLYLAQLLLPNFLHIFLPLLDAGLLLLQQAVLHVARLAYLLVLLACFNKKFLKHVLLVLSASIVHGLGGYSVMLFDCDAVVVSGLLELLKGVGVRLIELC